MMIRINATLFIEEAAAFVAAAARKVLGGTRVAAVVAALEMAQTIGRVPVLNACDGNTWTNSLSFHEQCRTNPEPKPKTPKP